MKFIFKIFEKLKFRLIKLYEEAYASPEKLEALEQQARFSPWQKSEVLKNMEFVSIGRYSYGLDSESIIRATSESPVEIGNFCSFAPGVKILAHANHPTKLVSTYPFKTLFVNSRSKKFDPYWSNHDATTKGAIKIGHDVWVGQNVIILSGITIGNGAVIGAGAVVTKDIPPYAIAVGNPAKVVSYRFDNDTIAALEKIQWWYFSDEEIERFMPLFYSDPDLFIAKFKNNIN